MGGSIGGNRAPTTDPFYNPVPPPAGLGPAGVTPLEEYELTTTLANYGGPVATRPNPYGGLYAQGLNQVPGVAPWNYGNYYLGNTTMQMMPMMLNKIHKYGQAQAMAILGNAGLLGGSAPMMQNMSAMPCCIPPSFNMSMAAPMMAAAAPLPIAFNPLIQGMYPMASASPVNWMTPSSFMSALTAGPMPYRPPAFDFPSNVGMVMTLPYGTPNPLFSSPSFGGFNTAYNYSGGSTSYPYSMSVPPIAPLWPSQGAFNNTGFVQPPVLGSNINTMPLIPPYRPPVNTSLPVYDASDKSNYLIGQQVTSSLSNPPLPPPPPVPVPPPNYPQYSSVTSGTLQTNNQFTQPRDTFSDRFRRYIPSIPLLSRTNYSVNQSYTRRDPVTPPILHGQLIYDSGWLPKGSEAHKEQLISDSGWLPKSSATYNGQLISDSGWLPKTSKTYKKFASMLSGKRKKRSVYTPENTRPIFNSKHSRITFTPSNRRRSSGSSASEYDCAICQQQREKRRLQDHYGSSTVSSLVNSPKESRKYRFSSNESAFSSKSRTPPSSKHGNYKSHRRHPTRIRIKSKSPSLDKPTSPILLRQSPIREERLTNTINEEDDEEYQEPQQIKQNFTNDNDSDPEKSDHYDSKISLRTIDE